MFMAISSVRGVVGGAMGGCGGGDKRMFAGCDSLNMLLIDKFKFEKDPDKNKYKDNSLHLDRPTLRQVLSRGTLTASGRWQIDRKVTIVTS